MNLRDLFHEAVDHVEPRPALDDIRARVSGEPAMSPRLRILAPLAAAAAVAAIAGGFLLTSGGDPSGRPDTPPATSPSPSGTSAPSPTPSPDATPPAGETRAVPVYFVGDTPNGPRLYREFHRVPRGNPELSLMTVADQEALEALRRSLAGDAEDPDYRSDWPDTASVRSVRIDREVITIDLDGAVHDLPAGLTQAQAQIGVEQAIYTAQAVYGKGRLAVQFLLEGKHTDQVLGQPASEPLANGNPVDTLSLVNISSPAEGQEVKYGSTLAVSGVANSFEATVPLRLLRGDEVVWEGFATAEGCCEEKLFPFNEPVPLGQLSRGTYVLEATTSDASGGAEGNGPYVDTRTIEVR